VVLNITGKLEQALNDLIAQEWSGPKPSAEDLALAIIAERTAILKRYYGTRGKFARDIANIKNQYGW